MAGFDHAAAKRMGFPLTFQDPAALLVVRFQPWYERECKRVLEGPRSESTRTVLQSCHMDLWLACMLKRTYNFVIFIVIGFCILLWPNTISWID
jgi:hypothetical protein